MFACVPLLLSLLPSLLPRMQTAFLHHSHYVLSEQATIIYASVSLASRGIVQLNQANETVIKICLHPTKDEGMPLQSLSLDTALECKKQLKLQQPFWTMS